MISPEHIKGTFIVSLYDASGRFVGCNFENMREATSFSKKDVAVTTTNPAATYKIMFWSMFGGASRLGNMNPYCEIAQGQIQIKAD